MSECCTPRGYRRLFSEKAARAQARRYRSRGLDRLSLGIVALASERGVQGRTVLEVGGGIGAIQIELLRAGAARVTSVELTPTYEGVAGELLQDVGLTDRVERRVANFVEAPDIDRADIVVMNRVVCCYHDMHTLIDRAADCTRGLLLLTFPKDRYWTRLVVAIMNLGLRASRREFAVFVRPSEQIRRAAEARGLRTLADRPGLFWETVALERPAAALA